jgi:hypothetical protein
MSSLVLVTAIIVALAMTAKTFRSDGQPGRLRRAFGRVLALSLFTLVLFQLYELTGLVGVLVAALAHTPDAPLRSVSGAISHLLATLNFLYLILVVALLGVIGVEALRRLGPGAWVPKESKSAAG